MSLQSLVSQLVDERSLEALERLTSSRSDEVLEALIEAAGEIIGDDRGEWRADPAIGKAQPRVELRTERHPQCRADLAHLSHAARANGVMQAVYSDTSDTPNSWDSALEKLTELSLTADATGAYSEVWRFTVGQQYHVEFTGVPEAPLDPDYVDADD